MRHEKHLPLIKSFFSVGALRFASIPLGLLINILLARILGPANYGNYSFLVSLTLLASSPALGIRQFIIREVATLHSGKNEDALKGFYKFLNIWAITFSVLVIFLLWSFNQASVIANIDGNFLFISLLLTFSYLNYIRLSYLTGLQKPFISNFFEQVSQPLIFIAGISASFLFLASSVNLSLFIKSISILASVIGLSYIINKYHLNNLKSTSYQIKKWLYSMPPFFVITFFVTLNAEIATFILGFLGKSEDIAGLQIAQKIAVLIGVGMLIVNSVIGPKIVDFNISNKKQLQKLLQSSAKFSSLLAIPLAFLFILFGEEIIAILFGEEYVLLSYYPMLLLVLSQLLYVSFGSNVFLLNMTNHQNDTLKVSIITCLVTFTLCLFLIPSIGNIGAAVSIFISNITACLIYAYIIFKRFNFRITVI